MIDVWHVGRHVINSELPARARGAPCPETSRSAPCSARLVVGCVLEDVEHDGDGEGGGALDERGAPVLLLHLAVEGVARQHEPVDDDAEQDEEGDAHLVRVRVRGLGFGFGFGFG